MKQMNGVGSLVMCALFWSIGGLLIKFVDWNPFAIAGIRSFIALIFISVYFRRFPVLVDKNEDGSINVKSTVYMWLAGLCYSITMVLFVIANKLTTAANTILLQYTNPIYIIIFGPFILGEKNKKSDYLAAVGVLFGMFLFFSDGLESGNQLGNVLAALSGVSFGFTTIFMRKQENDGSSNSFMIAHIFTLAVSIPFMILSGVPNVKSICGMVLLGVFQMGIPSITYSIGIKRVRALSASFITMLEPLMNPVWVLIFAHEVPGFKCVLGGIVILGTIAIRALFQTKMCKTV